MPMILWALLVAGADAEPLEPGNHARQLTVDGDRRTYHVHVPKSYDRARPAPLVLAFHGGATNGNVMARYSGLDDKSDAAGFIVAYPDGTGRLRPLYTFNAGSCCNFGKFRSVDDVEFTRALLDDLASVVNIDRQRVYATGISNGGMMAYRLAAELSDRIAAIASVAGPMCIDECRPTRPVSVLHIHGTDDKFVPYEGGVGEQIRFVPPFQSVEQSIKAWVKANGCPQTPLVEELPDRHDDGTTVTRTTYGPGDDGAEVILLTIHGGGHTWPSRPSPNVLGKSTREISANDLIWEFFQRRRLDGQP